MSNKKVFSKMDLKNTYRQFPMQEQSIEKTSFLSGPGYGLWEFTVITYGLTGATRTSQRELDEILKDCKDCVDNHVDNCIVFADEMASHITDLNWPVYIMINCTLSPPLYMQAGLVDAWYIYLLVSHANDVIGLIEKRNFIHFRRLVSYPACSLKMAAAVQTFNHSDGSSHFEEAGWVRDY